MALLTSNEQCPACKNGGICNMTTNECICPPGYDGVRCEQRAEFCNANNCPEPKACISGTCLCPDGVNCGNTNSNSKNPLAGGSCSSQPCLNGAICRANGNDFVCECAPGWNGICSFLLIIIFVIFQ